MLGALLCAAGLSACAGGLDDIERFAPPAPDGGGASDAGAGDAGLDPDAGSDQDAGMPDAGEDDAGVSDAGSDADAGTYDAGEDDAGASDAGSDADAGATDAGEADGGSFDAGEADGGGESMDAGESDDGGLGQDAGLPDAGRDAGSDAGVDAGAPDAGHDGGTPDAGAPDAGACNALTQIIAPTCATALCHSKGTAQAGLDLQSPGLPFRLIEQPATGDTSYFIIDGDDPDRSALYLKVLNPPPFGAQMPQQEKALTAAQQQCLKAWVEGAVQ